MRPPRLVARVSVGVAAVTLLLTALAVGPVQGASVQVQGAYAWGNNQTGELADGTVVNPRLTPVASLGQEGTVSISAGEVHSLAIRNDGTVIAWGHNRSGQLGDGGSAGRTRPVQVAGLTRVTAISAGGSFSLAARADGSVYAWGNNKSGQLGDGKAPADARTPVQVVGLGPGSGVVAVAAGSSVSMALKADGTVLAWGNNAVGQVGDGRPPADRLTPTQVIGLGRGSGIVAIAAGGSFSMALRSDGAVFSWGNNASGQLGKGNNLAPVGNGRALPNQSAPIVVPGLGAGSGVTRIAAGYAFALASKSNGQVFAWGNNQSGQLGDGSAPNDRTRPAPVPGVTGAVAISAGRSHAIALGADGAVWTWGNNQLGQIGNGRPEPAIRPVRLTGFGGHRVVLVAAGGDHTHVLYGVPGSSVYTPGAPVGPISGAGGPSLPSSRTPTAVNQTPRVTG